MVLKLNVWSSCFCSCYCCFALLWVLKLLLELKFLFNLNFLAAASSYNHHCPTSLMASSSHPFSEKWQKLHLYWKVIVSIHQFHQHLVSLNKGRRKKRFFWTKSWIGGGGRGFVSFLILLNFYSRPLFGLKNDLFGENSFIVLKKRFTSSLINQYYSHFQMILYPVHMNIICAYGR